MTDRKWIRDFENLGRVLDEYSVPCANCGTETERYIDTSGVRRDKCHACGHVAVCGSDWPKTGIPEVVNYDD